LYDDKGEITLLTESNFEATVLDDENSIWVVQFYSPSCTFHSFLQSERARERETRPDVFTVVVPPGGHCHKMAAAYKDVSKRLRGMVKVGVVDGSVERGLGGRYGIQVLHLLLLLFFSCRWSLVVRRMCRVVSCRVVSHPGVC
jgi:thioredoxin-like negative regulator of GroEL